uniref:Glutaredoxin domain-containing protein n=1 Tax=Macrostomum lignano TaxID=282301 RepID=A0A1I8JGH6_9PLAT
MPKVTSSPEYNWLELYYGNVQQPSFEELLASDTERELKRLDDVPGAHYCGKFVDIKPILKLIKLSEEIKKGIDNDMPLRARINNFQLKIEKCNDRYKIHVARVVGGDSFANPLTQLPCGCAI